MANLKRNFSAILYTVDSFLQSGDIIFPKSDSEKEQAFDKIAAEKKRKMQEKLWKRHIFVIQPYAVPCR